MSWGLKLGSALLGAAALAAAAAHPAMAADLGGDCCADLEERVAELEATTARKGNRKVSLEVSGQVNEALLFWDDGEESNVYIGTNDTGRTRFRFKGKAKIDNDWEAGYLLEIGVRTPRLDRVDQGGAPNGPGTSTVFGDDGTTDGFDIRHSSWYLKSKALGQIVVGRTDLAAESITEINLANTGAVAKLGDIEDHFAGFQLRRSGVAGDAGLSNIEWRRLLKDDATQPGESNRRDVVRYVSPTFQGFTASAAWGEDDVWDVALRYAGEFGGFKLAAGIAYGENSEFDADEDPQPLCIVNNKALDSGDASCHQLGGSVSVLHVSTGLFVSAAAGRYVDENLNDPAVTAFGGQSVDDESEYWTVQAGIEKKFFPIGKTTIYGEYFKFEGGANDQNISNADVISPFFLSGGNSNILNSEIREFGAGIVQSVDAAAADFYIVYRHYEADATFRNQATGKIADIDAEDLDTVLSGAIIKF